MMFSLLILAIAALAAPPNPSPAPRRIVTLAPNLTAWVLALGAGSRLAGVTTHDKQAEVAGLPRVASYQSADVERILALRPELVIGTSDSEGGHSILRLQRLGLRVVLLPFGSYDDVIRSLRKLGALLGAEKQAKRRAEKLEALRQATKRKKPPVRALAVVSLQPLVAAGPSAYIDGIIRAAGAANALRGSLAPYPQLNLESLLILDPDLIIDVSWDNEPDPLVRRGKAMAYWRRFAFLRAVKQGRIWTPDPDLIQQAGPKITQAVQALRSELR